MPLLKTKAVVLKRRDVGELDRLVTLYTYDLGKVEAKATAARKVQSKLASHLEPFFCIDVMLAPGRRSYKIAGAQITQSFSAIRKNISKITAAASFVRLVDESTKERHRDPYIYNWLEKSLLFLAENKVRPIFLAHIFAWKLVAHLGYRPELNFCRACHKKLLLPSCYFSLDKGGFFCPDCSKDRKNLLFVSSKTVNLLKQLLMTKLELLQRLKADDKVLKEAYGVIEQFASYQLEKSLKI